jgi:HEAT repeat protein
MLLIVILLVGTLSLGAFAVVAAKWAVPAVRQLAGELRDNDDPVVRSRAAWWLGEHEDRDGVSQCIDGLQDESADVRLVSAWALGEIKDRSAIAPLIEVLEDDSDVLVREMAALALGEIEDPRAVDPLMAAFEHDRELRGAVVWALGEIENRGSRSAADARLAAFDEWGRRPWRNDEVWTGDLDESYPDSRNVGAILNQLQSDDSDTRRDAALDLGYLGVRRHYHTESEVERVVDALIVTLRDPVPEVRAAAVWSLDEINPSRSAGYRVEHGFKLRLRGIKDFFGAL